MLTIILNRHQMIKLIKRLTTEEAAFALGVSYGCVAAWKMGKRTPKQPEKHRRRLEEYLEAKEALKGIDPKLYSKIF